MMRSPSFPSDAKGSPRVTLLARRSYRSPPKHSILFTTIFLSLVVVSSYFYCHRYARLQESYASHEVYAPNLLIDGHNDFPIWIRAFYRNHIYQKNFSQEAGLFGQVDFPRLKEGGVRGQFWSVYVECPENADNHSEAVLNEIVHDTLQQIDLVHRLIREYPIYMEHAWSATDISRISSSIPTIASLMGIEGLHQISNSASILRMYYSLGVRYATLTHTCHNAYADSEEPAVPLHKGLSEAGREIVKEMNRIGMIVDLSHTSFETQRDALYVTAAPVIYSHSNAYTRCAHTRNVPDDILRSLKSNDGVIMVTFYASFLELNPDDASLSSVADHIIYIGDLIGYRHVGIGSDFDGMDKGPKGLEDVSKYPALFDELRSRGVGEAELQGVMGINVLRVLEHVEKVSRSLRTGNHVLVPDCWS
ncbi:membrane dipeptidase-domain-containing protein [Truncatella angustata]|uniref:Dipeptidase n=1 Tax=Truncatella angustata TaxID=152316 RepID=A0A9P8USA8_9PEZI|nr:membrane dipeptidase-domain-containing protein [Truncatella angustata]KAH6657433.1 membrane dipeptidase-domain-containing protein [Truncatella angustata]